jgi:hypothetical protein
MSITTIYRLSPYKDKGVQAYSDYVHTQITKLKNAKPSLLISVQVSTQQGNALMQLWIKQMVYLSGLAEMTKHTKIICSMVQ